MCDVRGITRDYFKAMRIPLLRGRIFTAEDRADDAVKKVIVNEAAVRTYWPNEDPIGKRITMPWGSDLKGEIIGVVGDVRVLKLDVAARTQIYWYLPQQLYDLHSIGQPAIPWRSSPPCEAGWPRLMPICQSRDFVPWTKCWVSP